MLEKRHVQILTLPWNPLGDLGPVFLSQPSIPHNIAVRRKWKEGEFPLSPKDCYWLSYITSLWEFGTQKSHRFPKQNGFTVLKGGLIYRNLPLLSGNSGSQGECSSISPNGEYLLLHSSWFYRATYSFNTVISMQGAWPISRFWHWDPKPHILLLTHGSP